MDNNIKSQQINYGRIRAVSILTITATLVIIVTIGVFIGYRLVELNKASASAKHTNDVLEALHTVLETTLTGESGLRGFVYTGSEDFLEQYNTAFPKVGVLVKELHQWCKDNPDQTKDLTTLENAIADKFAFLKKLLDVRRAHGLEAARQLTLTNVGNPETNKIRSLIASMINRENNLLMVHTAQQKLNVDSALWGLFLIGATAAIFQIIMGLVLRHLAIRQKLSQEALIESQERFGLLLAGVKDYAIYMLDPQGRVLTWNTPAQKIKGYVADEIIGKHFSCFYGDEELAKDKPSQELAIALKAGRYEGEGEHKRKDGSKFWANVIIRPVYNRAGELEGFAEITHDITERKEAERRVSEFHSMISHELRSPLTSIRGVLALLEGGRLGQLSQQGQQLTRTALSDTGRLGRLINDFLDIQKIAAGKLTLKFTELVPFEIIASVLLSMETIANERCIKLLSQVNTADKILADRDHIVQVLTNLISNAIKFSAKGQDVLVKVESVDTDIVRFSVVDKGRGIPEGEIHKLFVQFQQVSQTDTMPRGGTGLGLAISKAIVEKHGGRIGVNSVYGKGSTFWFDLPCKAGVIIPKTPDFRYKILLVESDHSLYRLLSESLAAERFAIDEAPSLEQAEQYLAAESNPDVVLLDIKLPDGNGLELLDKLRQSEKTHNVPVVVITGCDPALGTYAHPLLIDWIRKPFDQQRLLSALQLAVRARAPGRARVLVVDDDPAMRAFTKEALKAFDIECFEAADGIEAINIARTREPDLIILDLTLELPDDFGVVAILRQGNARVLPLLAYTSRDLTEEDKRRLTLGLSVHLTKARTSEQQFLDTVRNLLDGLVQDKASPNKATAGAEVQIN